MSKKTARSKATIAQKRQRIAQVLEWIVEGRINQEIIKLARGRWKVGESTVYGYINHVKREILPTWYEWNDQRVMAAELIVKLQKQHRQATRDKQHAAAVSALRQIAELQGLNSSRQIAAERDTLQRQIVELKTQRTSESNGAGEGMPVDQANAIRSAYGQPLFLSQADYDSWLSQIAPGGNGKSNGHGN